MFNMFGQTRASQKDTTGQRMSKSIAKCYGLCHCGSLYGIIRRLKVYLAQHDIIWTVRNSKKSA